MAKIADGKRIATKILDSLKKRIEKLKKRGTTPVLATVLVGEDAPSRIYVNKKEGVSTELGINFLLFEYPATISKTELTQEIHRIQLDHQLSGLIIQLPLPKKLQKHSPQILNSINPEIDVDCLTDASLGEVLHGTNQLTPPTAGAVLEILKYYRVSLRGKHIVVVGRGELVGKPLTNLLLNQPVTLTVCGSKTKNLSQYTKQADILISAVGKPNLITGNMIKKGSIVLDAGTSSTSGTLVGDIEFESVRKRASLVTPTPGGVGPVTVAKLLENVIANAERLSRSFRKL